PAAAIDGITATNPALLDLGAVAGLQFGLALAFAILGAELINQTWWQRIYAADSSETVGRSFRTAALANGAIVFVTAFFGVVAVGNAAVVTDPASAGYNADAAFFVLLGEAFPEWLVLAAVLLALLLVMSSIDTLFNALSSLVTADLARLLAEPSDRRLALGSRALTIAVAAAAIYVSLRAQSVLRLFFFADLLGAAVAFPLVYGLYSTRITGLGALASSLTGLAVGLAFFPDLRGVITSIPVVGGLLPAADPLYLTSFGGAFVVSTAASLVAARLADAGFDLGRLSREIRRFDDGQTDAPSSD
ncbi:sodium-solute symporter, partial [Haloferax sp. BAB-2207]